MREVERLPLEVILSETEASRKETRYSQAKAVLFLIASTAALIYSVESFLKFSLTQSFVRLAILPATLNLLGWAMWLTYSYLSFTRRILSRGWPPPPEDMDTRFMFERYEEAMYALRRARQVEVLVEMICGMQFFTIAGLIMSLFIGRGL